jgi:hypothetical protein
LIAEARDGEVEVVEGSAERSGIAADRREQLGETRAKDARVRSRVEEGDAKSERRDAVSM